jgi:hypothetical protein
MQKIGHLEVSKFLSCLVQQTCSTLCANSLKSNHLVRPCIYANSLDSDEVGLV